MVVISDVIANVCFEFFYFIFYFNYISNHFIFQDWVVAALREDPVVWKNYCGFPDSYKRIKIYRIQHYADTGRMEQAKTALQHFMEDTRKGRMQRGWDDFGRLK